MSGADRLRELESLLLRQWRTGKQVERYQAGAYAHVIRRLLDDKKILRALQEHGAEQRFTTKARHFYIALDYAIRCELADRKHSLKVRGETAKAWRAADATVSKYKTRHKKAVQHWMKKLDGNLAYAGLTRKEMLKRELRAISPTINLDNPRRKSSNSSPR